MRCLFEGGAYSSNYCNWQLKSLLHLGQIVITFRTLLHLGQNVITFRTLLHLGLLQMIFLILMQIKLIFTRKVLDFASFLKVSFWNSQMAYQTNKH